MMPPAPLSGAAHDAPTGFRHFHDQLETLKERLLTMSDRAEGLVDLAVDALLKHDKDRADAVIAGDREVDTLELEVEELAVELLALQQPMARDLRFIVSAIKISSDLERVGDHAVNIAQCAQRLIAIRSTITPEPEIEDMARRARGMLGDALDAFIRADGTLGRDVCKSDDAVDALLNSLFRILLTHMMADARNITPSLELILVGRNLERVADLATNIGEDAVFLAEGKQIKHHFDDPARRPAGPPALTGMRGTSSPDDSRQERHAGAWTALVRNGGTPGTGGAGATLRANRDTVRVAAIDIGSNSIRQMVADVSPGGTIRVVDQLKAQPRLGTGVSATGELAAAPMQAAVDALSRTATLARQLRANRIEAVATSAARDATNGRVFIDRVRAETGLKVRTLDGEDEARLTFRSALAHFDLGVGR